MKQKGSILLYGLLALAILTLLSGIAWKIRESGKDAIRLEWAEANRLQREAEAKKASEASTKLETAHAKARIIYRTNTQFVDKIVERVEYRNVCLDAVGLCVANASIRGESAAACKPSKPVPPAGRVTRRDDRLDLALDRGEFGALPGLLSEAPGAGGGG